MNTSLKRKMSCCELALGFVAACVLWAGCREPAFEQSRDWLPRTVGGPLVVRPLPPASQLEADYVEWLRSSTQAEVRLYEVVISDPLSQKEFSHEVVRADTPLGRPLTTFASFIYTDPVLGSFQMEWMEVGRLPAKLIKVEAAPKKFLVRVIQLRDVPMPRLQICGVEGVRFGGVLVASPPDRVLRALGAAESEGGRGSGSPVGQSPPERLSDLIKPVQNQR